jgi:hypothetical protein
MPISKEESKTRWSQLRALLCEWDPIGVMADPGASRDEYDCIARPVLGLLEGGASEAEIATHLRNEMAEHFGMSAESGDFIAVAHRLRTWFVENWSAPKGAG